MKQVVLRKKKAGSAMGGHPWVYDWMIDKIEGDMVDGDHVAVYTGETNQFIANGLWNEKGEVRIRLYSFEKDALIDQVLFETRLKSALKIREELGYFSKTQGCRVLYGDAEGFPGLNIDYFAGYLVVQIGSSGLIALKETLLKVLSEVFSPKGIQVRMPALLSGQKNFSTFEVGTEPSSPVVIEDRDLKFYVDLSTKQKTGFYLDQRENRHFVASLSKGKNVLDLYSFSGAFGIACSKRGASSVVCVDSSEEAMNLAKNNIELNAVKNISTHKGDVIEYLDAQAEQSLDMIILDPPKLAQGHASGASATSMYHRINQSGIRALKRGGILVSCSCSGRVETQDWLSTLASAARRSGRFMTMLTLKGASYDHPVSLHCPETAYLKCGVFVVN